MLTKEVAIDFNVLSLFMKDWVGGDVYGLLIVTEHDEWIGRGKAYLNEKLSKPQQLRCNISHDTIFGVCTD